MTDAPGVDRSRLAAMAAAPGRELGGVARADSQPEDRRRMERAVAEGRMGRMGWMGGTRPEVATDPARLAGPRVFGWLAPKAPPAVAGVVVGWWFSS